MVWVVAGAARDNPHLSLSKEARLRGQNVHQIEMVAQGVKLVEKG